MTDWTMDRLPVQTLREKAMVSVMEEITDIPEWWKKVPTLLF